MDKQIMFSWKKQFINNPVGLLILLRWWWWWHGVVHLCFVVLQGSQADILANNNTNEYWTYGEKERKQSNIHTHIIWASTHTNIYTTYAQIIPKKTFQWDFFSKIAIKKTRILPKKRCCWWLINTKNINEIQCPHTHKIELFFGNWTKK